MNRVFILILALLMTACQGSESGASSKTREGIEDGESSPRTQAQRELMRGQFKSLVDSKTIAEERQAVAELLKALKAGQYKLQLTRQSKPLSKDGLVEAAGKESELSLTIACPYFPPVTPWVTHKFHDYKNALALKDYVLEP